MSEQRTSRTVQMAETLLKAKDKLVSATSEVKTEELMVEPQLSDRDFM